MKLPDSIARLIEMPGFWPDGWEATWLDGKRLGVRCKGAWVVNPRSSERAMEMETLSRLQSALDSQMKMLGTTALALAGVHNVTILRERAEVTDMNGAKVEFYGRRLYAMAGGSIIAGPTIEPIFIERALDRLDQGAQPKKEIGGSLSGLVRDDRPVDEPRTSQVPRG